MSARSRPHGADRGASGAEYAGLIALAALICGTLVVVIPNPVGVHTKAAICRILHTDADCAGGGVRTQEEKDDGDRCAAFCPTKDNPIHPSDPLTSATKGNYAALGDSYSSGEGANGKGRYLGKSDHDKCHRAKAAFSEGVRNRFMFKGGGRFAACSGATTDDLAEGKHGEPPQLDALDAKTTTVTLSVGGDDLHFSNVMKAP